MQTFVPVKKGSVLYGRTRIIYDGALDDIVMEEMGHVLSNFRFFNFAAHADDVALLNQGTVRAELRRRWPELRDLHLRESGLPVPAGRGVAPA